MIEQSAASWNSAYWQGKYDQESAVPFLQDIVNVITERDLINKVGFYPGCGNGRNFIPLVDAGLTLEGNDISSVAIEQLLRQKPAANVSVGEFLAHKAEQSYAYLLSLQLFQHGDYKTVQRLFDKAHTLLGSGGLFVLRVNSIHTQIIQKHKLVEYSSYGGFTVRYLAGQKTGLQLHFYSAEELHNLTRERYNIVLPLREEFIARDDGTHWVQWETILEKN